MDNEFVLRCVKFDFYLESLIQTAEEQSNENREDQRMITKYNNLVEESNQSPDDDNQTIYQDDQDSKKRKRNQEDTWSHIHLHLWIFFSQLYFSKSNDVQWWTYWSSA